LQKTSTSNEVQLFPTEHDEQECGMPQDSEVILKVPYQLVKQNSRSTCHSTEKNLNSFNQQKTVLQVQAQYLTKSTFIRKMEVSIAKGTMFFGNVMSSTCLTSSQVQRHQEQKPMFPLSLQRT